MKTSMVDNYKCGEINTWKKTVRLRINARSIIHLPTIITNVRWLQIDKPVEFEVSMGNFGNKFEDSVMPSPSTTQPTNAVYDGCR